MANLQPSFIKMLLAAPQDPVDPAKTYKCANCYRPDIKADFIALVSHGEAYCRGCVKVVV